MKNRRIHIAIVASLTAVLVAGVAFTTRSSIGQSPASIRTDSPVKRTVAVTEPARDTEPSPFAEAINRNAALRNELSWTFGGKQQRGWYLYDLLIARTLDTKDEFKSNDFAAALARWQKDRRLSPSGVLDSGSLMAMVSHWQSRRLKNGTYAQVDRLVTAPPTDFYDPQRAAQLRQVDRDAYAAYQEMIAAAMADPTLNLKPSDKYLKIVSAFRSREYQEHLRRQSPNAGRAALAVNSPHFTGRALDIYVGGSPVDTSDANRAIQVNTPAYRWLVNNAERFGFRPYFYEPWHWEYVR